MSSDQAPERGSFWKSSLGYATQVVGLVGAILAIVTAVITLTGGGDSGTGAVRSSTQDTPRPKLQVVDLAIAGGHREMCLDDNPDPQRLDVTVRNTGNQPAVIKRLGLRVLKAGLLRIPASGGIEPSKAYDILLPPKPTPGEVVRYKLSQEVKPRADDRFTVRMDEPQAARQDRRTALPARRVALPRYSQRAARRRESAGGSAVHPRQVPVPGQGSTRRRAPTIRGVRR